MYGIQYFTKMFDIFEIIVYTIFNLSYQTKSDNSRTKWVATFSSFFAQKNRSAVAYTPKDYY